MSCFCTVPLWIYPRGTIEVFVSAVFGGNWAFGTELGLTTVPKAWLCDLGRGQVFFETQSQNSIVDNRIKKKRDSVFKSLFYSGV